MRWIGGDFRNGGLRLAKSARCWGGEWGGGPVEENAPSVGFQYQFSIELFFFTAIYHTRFFNAFLETCPWVSYIVSTLSKTWQFSVTLSAGATAEELTRSLNFCNHDTCLVCKSVEL